MTIRILSWRADSFTHEADDLRSADNDLLTHAKERMEFRLSQVIAELKAVLETDTGSWDHTFVTLPEFFWNTRWSNVLSEDELMQLGDFYMDHVSDYVNRLMMPSRPVPGIPLLPSRFWREHVPSSTATIKRVRRRPAKIPFFTL